MTLMNEQGTVPALSAGLRLEIARRTIGLNQTEMAEELGLTRRTVADFENDVRPPKRQTLIAWSRLTSISLEWLEDGYEWAPRGSNPEPAD